MRIVGRRLAACALLAVGCGGPGGALDAGPPPVDAPPIVDAFRIDSGPRDAGPQVPLEGWANAVASSDVAASITSGGTTYENVADDPMLAIGPPDGLTGAVALGDAPHGLVVDLGEGEE